MKAEERVRWGIDLGTTNSAIAVLSGDQIEVVKTPSRADVMPSAVAFYPDKDKTLVSVVGGRAQGRIPLGPRLVATEFKRYMGDPDWRFRVPGLGVEESAAELSARVLRQLQKHIGHWEQLALPALKAAVVTVPAEFKDHERADTLRAAELAGFVWAELMREPEAAALAYGYGSDTSHDPTWLVYDLGGGTFDAALVRAEDGVFTLIDHAGDKNTGGKNLDEAIIRELILPELGGELRDRIADVDTVEYRLVKLACERAKCLLAEEDFPVSLNVEKRIDGMPDIWLESKDVSRLVESTFRRTLETCHQLLAKNDFRPDQIEKVVLVGGSTLSPALRQMIKEGSAGIEGLHAQVDYSPSNALTAVVQGAAIFAASLQIPAEAFEAATVAAREEEGPPPEGWDIKVALETPTQVRDDSVLVTGKLAEIGSTLVLQPGWSVVFRRTRPVDPEPWSSEPCALTDTAGFHCRLPLDQGENEFFVEVYDHEDTVVPTAPTDFEILCMPVEIIPQSAPRERIGVAQASGRVRWLSEDKGSDANAAGDLFKTTKALEPGRSDDAISIPIVEGEYDKASLNRQIYELRISGENVSKTIPKHSTVQVKLDRQDRVWSVAVHFPDFKDVKAEAVRRPFGQPPEVTTTTLKTVRYNIARFKEVRFQSPELDSLLTEIDRAKLVQEVETLLEAGTAEHPDAWYQAGDRVLELMRLLDPHYARVEELRTWVKEHARCEENVTKAHDLVGKVAGQTSAWMAEYGALRDRYRDACEVHDVVQAHDIAFVDLPALFESSYSLAQYVGGSMRGLEVEEPLDRGDGGGGDLEAL